MNDLPTETSQTAQAPESAEPIIENVEQAAPTQVRCRYNRWRVKADIIWAGIGLICTILPLALFDLSSWIQWLFVGAAFLSMMLAVQAIWRALVELVHSEEKLQLITPLSIQEVYWQNLSDMKLRFFNPKKNDQESGWMELDVIAQQAVPASNPDKAPLIKKNKIRVTSALEEPAFELILRQAVKAAGENGLVPDSVTETNLAAWNLFIEHAEEQHSAEPEQETPPA